MVVGNGYATSAVRLAVLMLIGSALAPAAAAAAECRAGFPVATTDSVPDCACYQGSSPGTRVYAFVKNFIITARGNAHVYRSDARITCDAKGIYVSPGAGGRKRSFPADATVTDVLNQRGVTAQFAGVPSASSFQRDIREGRLRLIKTY